MLTLYLFLRIIKMSRNNRHGKTNEKSRAVILLFSHFKETMTMEKDDYFLEESPLLIIKYTNSNIIIRATMFSTLVTSLHVHRFL